MNKKKNNKKRMEHKEKQEESEWMEDAIHAHTYLTYLKKVFFNPQTEKKVFILGNPSNDMDCVMSCYLVSIGENLRNKVIEIDDANHMLLNPNAKMVYYPVLNTKRGTFKYRLDEQYVFDKFHLNSEDFFYIDDPYITEEGIKKQGNVSVILVDHSVLDVSEKYLAPYVTELYDHHIIEDLEFPNLKNRFIKYPVGSCSTLVLLSLFLENYPSTMLPPLFAVSAILLDTHNFRKDFYNNKWNDLDKTVFNIIMSHAQSKVDPDRYYKEMNGAKKDLEKNLAQGIVALYEKDKKTFEWGKNLCVWSSLPISFNKVVEKFGIEEVYKYFEEYKGKAKYYITSSFVENGNKVFYVFDQDHFKGDNRDDLKHQLTEVLKDHFTTINIMDDLADMFVFELDSTSSRKAVEPYIKKVFNKE